MPSFPRRSAWTLLALLALAVAAHADPDDEGWTPYAPPPPPPSGGGVVVPTTPEGGFGLPDRTRVDQQLRHGVLDQLCRQAQIPLNVNQGLSEYGSVGVGVDRALRTDVDGQVALVDDQKLSVSLSHGWTKAIGAGGEALGFSFGATIEGHSMVVRRTGTKQSCDEVLRLVDFRDVKTVLPMKGERLTSMALGELWRIPLTLSYAEGVSASETRPTGEISHSGPGAAAVTISFGRTDRGASSMTLYRIAPDKLRFRFRIDHVVAYSRTLGITETYPPLAFAIGAQNILTKFVEGQIAGQLNQYLSAWLTFGKTDSDGKKVLMEFVIDPRDPEQAESMAKVVRGDMAELVKMSVKMSTFQTKSTIADYLKLREQDAAQLRGPSTYAASDEYRARARTFALNLPLLVSHNSTALFGEDKVVRYSGADDDIHFYKVDKSKNNSYFTLPWVGPMVKDNTQRDVEVVAYAPHGQEHGDPIMVYIRNRGYLRVTGSTVRDDVEEINSVMKLAGARRGKDGSALTLPVDALVPPSPLIQPSGHGAVTGERPSEPSDRKGLMSFTLVFNQKAVKDAVAAPAQEVLKAFAATVGMDDKPLADWLASHAAIQDGRVSYDWRAARAAFPATGDEVGRGGSSDSATRELDDLTRKAAGLIADMAAVRDATNNEVRSKALAQMVGGKGQSGLSYEEVLKVLVQFVDPMDLTGDFVQNVSVSTKGVNSPNQHLVLKKGRQEVPLLKDAGDAKARFAEPSILTD